MFCSRHFARTPNRTWKLKRRRQNGVTLYEILITLAVLGILVAISVPAYRAATRFFQSNQAYNISEAVIARCRENRQRAIRSGTSQPLHLSDLAVEGVSLSLFAQNDEENPVFLPNGRCNGNYRCVVTSPGAEIVVRIDETGYADEEKTPSQFKPPDGKPIPIDKPIDKPIDRPIGDPGDKPGDDPIQRFQSNGANTPETASSPATPSSDAKHPPGRTPPGKPTDPAPRPPIVRFGATTENDERKTPATQKPVQPPGKPPVSKPVDDLKEPPIRRG